MPKRVYPYHKSRRWAFLWLAIQRYFPIFWHSRVATPNIEGEGHCARYLSMTSHREIKVTIIIRKNEHSIITDLKLKWSFEKSARFSFRELGMRLVAGSEFLWFRYFSFWSNFDERKKLKKVWPHPVLNDEGEIK